MVKKTKSVKTIKSQVKSLITCYIWDIILPSNEIVDVDSKQLETIKETNSYKKGKIIIL